MEVLDTFCRILKSFSEKFYSWNLNFVDKINNLSTIYICVKLMFENSLLLVQKI